MKTIQARRTRHAGHCWRSKDELISDVLLWTPAYGQAKAGRPARTYIRQLCEDTGCSPEDLPEAMNDREKWRERVRDIRASGTTWWWWWWWWSNGIFSKRKESVQENEMKKILWDFEIQTNHLIPARRLGLMLIRLIWFYGIPTTVGYLMPNHFYTYISNI